MPPRRQCAPAPAREARSGIYRARAIFSALGSSARPETRNPMQRGPLRLSL